MNSITKPIEPGMIARPRPRPSGSWKNNVLSKPSMPNQWIQDHFRSWDGTKIFYCFYPVPNARHTLIILHGYGDHSGRYEKFPERMRGLSVQMAAMDFRGMGRSEGARGTVGAFEDYLRDVSAFVTHLREKRALPKYFILFGHSMGGLVAVSWAMKDPRPVKMLILSAPFLGFRFSWVVGFLNWLVALVAPHFAYRSPVRSRALSHDPEEIASHRKDPLIVRHLSAHCVQELMKGMENLRKRAALSVSFPVYMLGAGKECIVDPAASKRFFDRLVAPHKERMIFDGLYHEIFNEKDQQKVFNVLKTMIEDCV
jgi:alpha-beta hydrolase superfamily lysophospholipase